VFAAAGRLKDFRACPASIKKLPKNGARIDQEAADLLEVKVGDELLIVSR